MSKSVFGDCFGIPENPSDEARTGALTVVTEPYVPGKETGQPAEVGRQSKNTLLAIFERYIEEYMTLFDAIWSV